MKYCFQILHRNTKKTFQDTKIRILLSKSERIQLDMVVNKDQMMAKLLMWPFRIRDHLMQWFSFDSEHILDFVFDKPYHKWFLDN